MNGVDLCLGKQLAKHASVPLLSPPLACAGATLCAVSASRAIGRRGLEGLRESNFSRSCKSAICSRSNDTCSTSESICRDCESIVSVSPPAAYVTARGEGLNTYPADFSFRHRWSLFGFAAASQIRHKATSPQRRPHSFAAQPPDLRHLALMTGVSRFHARWPCSAAPSHPDLVHRFAASFHAFFPHSVTPMRLRSTSFAVIDLRRRFAARVRL